MTADPSPDGPAPSSADEPVPPPASDTAPTPADGVERPSAGPREAKASRGAGADGTCVEYEPL
ncbi:hypothetical protein [Streptomyces sp. NPDC002690]